MTDWRQVKEIQEAKRVTHALKATAAIIIYIDEDAETIGYASYGTNGPRCTSAGKWAEVAYEAVQDYIEGTP